MAADRLLVLVAGRVAAEGPPADEAVRAALVAAFGGAVRILRVPDEPHEPHEPDEPSEPNGPDEPSRAGTRDAPASPDLGPDADRAGGRWVVVPRD
jgi:hypothetical protein